MSVSAKADLDDRAKIAAVREEWIQAVNKSDVDRMLTLVTDDVVAIHGDGHCQRGKEELKAGLLHITAAYDAERKVLSSELILRDKWAFQLDDMDNSMTPVRGGMEIRAHLRQTLSSEIHGTDPLLNLSRTEMFLVPCPACIRNFR